MNLVDFEEPPKSGDGAAAREPWRDGPPEGFGEDEGNIPPTEIGASPADVVTRWKAEGPLVRRAIGIPTLDDACRGGFPFPWRVFLVGAPSAGKTAIAMHIARHLATVHEDVFVGVLAIDEEDDDLTVRVAQMAGFTIEQCEGRDPSVLEEVRIAIEPMRVRFYGAAYTIEQAADDTARRAAEAGCRPVFILDSIQTARANAAASAETARGVVDANVAAVRAISTEHRMLVIATSEANRGSYRSNDAAESANDMAAGKESGGIEFSAQTLMMVRTPKGYPDNMSVTVPKNRRGARAGFEFFLRLNRERHSIVECADPAEGDAEHNAGKRAEHEKAQNMAQVRSDARVLAKVVRKSPDMGERDLRGAIAAAGHRWGVTRLDGARALLTEGAGVDGARLVNAGNSKKCRWRLESATEANQEAVAVDVSRVSDAMSDTV